MFNEEPSHITNVFDISRNQVALIVPNKGRVTHIGYRFKVRKVLVGDADTPTQPNG